MKIRKKETIINFFTSPILRFLIVALVVRLILSPFGTLELDQNTFIGWSNRLMEIGFSRFYDTWSDYLPGYLYILWVLGWIKKVILFPSVLLFKLPAIFSDVLTGFLIYKIVGKFKNKRWGIITSGLYLFNPAILANSTFWGQADSLTALFSLLAIWLIDMNPLLSSFALAFGTLIKPQAALAAPVVLFVMLKRKWTIQKILKYIITSFLLFVAAFIPFAGDSNLTLFIVERISVTLGQYPYTSVNAFNFWGLFGFWQKDIFATSLLGIVLAATSLLFGAKKLWKIKISRYLLLTIIFATNFLFFTRMHERHLLPVFAPLAIAASLNSNLWFPYIGFSLVYVINLIYSFVWITQSFTSILPFFMIIVCILFNLGFLLLIFIEIIKKKRHRYFFQFFKDLNKKLRLRPKTPSRKIKKLSAKTVKISLFIIIAFSLISRTLWLASPSNEYFDEVYHAFTARRMLHGDPKAWEWWNTPPEGFAYEWTHPPLAKLGMVLGMVVFGENSFGWRIPGALLGVGCVMLIYLIARKLFKDELIGLLSASVFALEGLPLVMSRIGMNDSYFLFFSLLALYMLLVDRYFLSAISFGLTASSKWSAVWLVPILLVAFFVFKKEFKPKYLLFIFVPPLIYLASYLPMFLTGHGFDVFIGVQKQMWWYHTRLEATHSYTSAWWSWPLLVRPVYLYTSNVVSGTVARIYAMGNPLIFWFGAFSILLGAFFAFVEKNKKLGFVIFSYFVFFASWAASPRIMFLYHYLPSIPFMAIAIGFILRRFPKVIIPFLTIALIVYLFFFPHLAGLGVPVWLDKMYYWLPSWR